MTTDQIVVIGSCNVDFVSYAPKIPEPGETVEGTEFVINFGGKGANQCVAAAKLGGNTAMIARVGDDLWGPKYIELLKKADVNTQYVDITSNVTTGVAQIIVCERTGENQIVIIAGANGMLQVSDIEAAGDIITKAGAVVLQLETSEDVAIKAMELCRGISILNGAPAQATYNPKLLELPTIFCVNETEASTFVGGLSVTNLSEVERAANELMSKGCNMVIITLGESGAFYMDKNEKCHIECPKVKCIDSTGAGDEFIGALAFLLVNKKGISMREAIRQSCKAASDSVTRPGTQDSFPNSCIFSRD